MKHIISLLLTLLSACNIMIAQDTRNVDIPQFKRVNVSSNIDLFLIPSSKPGLAIKGERNMISRVECKVTGDYLEIFLVGSFRWIKNKNIEVHLNYTELEYVAASAGSDVRCDSLITTPIFEIKGQSGSDIFLKLDVQKLKVTLSSGSSATLTGNADELRINASSGSDVKAPNMKTRRAIVNLSSGSDVIINVTSEMIINASGGSDVRYKGAPAIKEIDCSGGSDVRKY